MSFYTFFHPDDPTDPFPFSYMTPTRMVGQIPCPYPSAASPSDYLEFAIRDAAEGDARGHVNSFGNIKRAFHLVTDILLHQYGLFTHFRKENFPGKLRVLEELGLIPTTILGNLNLERNEIEHEYSVPPEKRVAEAIDVGKLVLMAVAKYLEATPQEAVVGWRNPRKHLVMQLEPHAGELRFYRLRGKARYRRSDGIRHFAGPLRELMTGELSPGVTISCQPWKTITLNRASTAEWSPIIQQLVSLQRRELIRGSREPNEGMITIGVAIPIIMPQGVSFSQVLSDAFKKKPKRPGRPSEKEADRSDGETSEDAGKEKGEEEQIE